MAKQLKSDTTYSIGKKNITKTIDKSTKAKVDSAFKSDMKKLDSASKAAKKNFYKPLPKAPKGK